MGLGFWTRANPEQCLLATRGRPRRLSRSVPQLIVAPRREHSRKPEEARERIEHLIAGPYAELFARDGRPGWDSWGTEAGLFNSGPVSSPSAAVESRAREGRTINPTISSGAAKCAPCAGQTTGKAA